MQRSLLIFQNSLRSQESVKAYTYNLEKFLSFYKLRDFDSMLTITVEKLQIMIEDYVMELKRKLNPNSIPSYVNPLKLFLESNDIDLNWRKIKRLFPAPVKPSGDAAYSTEDIKKMLDCTPNLRNKTLIHFLASTGCRIGALPELKLKHLTEIPLGCKAILVYEDSIEEYYTFLTPEASEILDDYLEQRKKDKEYLSPESPLFRTRYSLDPGVTYWFGLTYMPATFVPESPQPVVFRSDVVTGNNLAVASSLPPTTWTEFTGFDMWFQLTGDVIVINGQVGGEFLPIETTSLLLAGAQSFSWMIPVILSGIGIGLFVVSRKSENS